MMEKTKKKRSRRTCGAILVLAIVMVIILALLGIVMVRLGGMARVRSAHGTTDISARSAADAGLTQALRLMNNKLRVESAWDNSTLPQAADTPLPHSDGQFSYKVEGTQKAGFRVVSKGKCAFSERNVLARLSIETLWFGIGVKEDVDIMSKTNFVTIPAGSGFTIRTNSIADGAISLYPNTSVPGDVIIGPGGDPATSIDVKSSSIIAGDSYAAEEEIDFPDVVVPTLPYVGLLPPVEPNDPNLITLTAADSGIYDFITLTEFMKLHIVQGDVVLYVTDKVRLHNSSEIRILEGASLKLYLGDDMWADNGSRIITEGHLVTGTRLKIFGTNTCTEIILKNSGDLAAAIYAPYAELTIMNSGAVYGALTGNRLEMKNSGEFYFDTRLLEYGIDVPAMYTVDRWWEEKK
jgi:Tfp pilus assembly protein PilX